MCVFPARATTRFYVLALIAFFFPGVLRAQITVNSAIFHLKFGERPVQNVFVGNSSSEPGFVVVTVEEITDPEMGGTHFVPTQDLLVSPKSFSVEPNGTRTVRILRKSLPAEHEKVYRVSFSPQDKGFGEEIETSTEGRKAVLRVLTGMGILVFADPANPVVNLAWQRQDDKVIFSNSGNLHAQLVDGKSCDKENKNCEKLPGKRVYGGTHFEVKVPGDRRVSYLKRSGASGEMERITIEPIR
jgi:P pilus assembly chaperone PapD